MKMRKGCLIILCCLLMCSFFKVASGKTIYVDDDDGKDYNNIQEALNASDNGDIIFVYNGTYYEHLLINKSISLIGENYYNTIINGNATGTVISVIADEVNISNFTITNSGKYFSACLTSGIAIYSDFNNISNNYITNNCDGISLSGMVCYPYIYTLGWHLSSGNHNIIVGNAITNNTISIVLGSSCNNQISENSITNFYNYTGKEFEGKEGIHSLGGEESRGIELYSYSCNNTINKNNISGHKYGILIPANLSTNNTICKNIIKNNNCGIYLFSDSSDNNISDNTYFDNVEDTYYETTKQEKSDGGTPGFELILIIIAIALVLFWQRKRI